MVRIQGKPKYIPMIVTPFRRAVGGTKDLGNAVAHAFYEAVCTHRVSHEQRGFVRKLPLVAAIRRAPGITDLTRPIAEFHQRKRKQSERTRRERIVNVADADRSEDGVGRWMFECQEKAG